MQSVRINRKGADRRRAGGHPWIFSSDVLDRGGAQPGDAVRVIDPRGEPLGVAHYSSTSQITLRMLSSEVIDIDRQFFVTRLQAAAAHRSRIVSGSDAYRLVHGEGDLLPGLVIDRYGDYFVLQTLSQGMDRIKQMLAEILTAEFAAKAVIVRNDAAVRKHESLETEVKVLCGEMASERVSMSMNGLQLHADLLHGQKTGVFLDQRENYAAAARYAHGRALDCFTCTGGFALHMAKSCESVEAIDSSEAALETARANASANAITNIHWKSADVFDVLSSYSRSRATFQTIVLDPPAFTKSRSAVEGALRGYKDINLRALRLLEPGGILITNSCSHHISEADLLGVVAEASIDARKTLRVLERRTQSADHPILLTVPETLYLKCLILQVV